MNQVITMISRLYLAVPAAVAVASLVGSPVSAAAAPSGVRLSSHPLGLNVSPQQTADVHSASRNRMDADLRALGATNFRYGGGTFADTYDWRISRDTYNDLEQARQSDDFTGPDSHYDALRFSAYAAEARAIGASGTVTVNYGSGTPGLARAWAADIAKTHAPVAYVEVGNEPYGCGSVDFPITRPPVSDTGYEPNDPPACPYAVYGSAVAGLKKFAESYIAHAPAFISAVRAADPALKIVLPYAISPPGDGGYVWNDAVMPAVRGYSGIDVLWYPTRVPGTEYPEQQVLSWLADIPARAAAIKSDIARYAPGRFWMLGEDGISNHRTYDVCQPVAAVFAAGSALSWLAAGARSVDWWKASDSDNARGRCKNPDYAMFDSTGVRQPPYDGFLLASKLARPHAALAAVNSRNGKVLAFHAYLPGGRQGAALVNLSATSKETATAPGVGRGAVTVWRYSAGHPHIARSHLAGQQRKVTVPPDSVTVFVR
jgi:hypothetical protein